MRRKIIFQSFLIALITALAVFFAGIGTHYWAQEQRIKQEIVADANAFSAILSQDAHAFDDIKDFGTARITVVAEDGTVIFDSAKGDSANMDNHLGREEIASAFDGNPVLVKRYSQTFGYDMYYYAVKTSTPQGDVVLRVSEKASNVWSYTGIGILYVAIALVVAFLLSFLLAKNLSDKVENQLTGLRDRLRNINNGDYAPIEYRTSDAINFSIISEMNDIVVNLQDSYDEIQSQKAKLGNIIDNMTQGIIVVDSDRNIELTNNVATSLFGQVKTGDNLIKMIDDLSLYDKITAALSSGENSVFPYVYRERDLVINVFRMHVDDNSRNELGIILIGDVTKENELSRQKSIFFANASHELKTPLTSIQGLSEVLLSRTDENSSDYKYLKRIYTESVRLSRIVMDMLYISKLEAKTVDRKTEKVSLAALCSEAEQAYKDEIAQKGIAFSIDGDATVEADEHNLYECVNNVIGNAVHYNKQNGFVKVTLFSDGGKAVMSVADGGIGIAKEHLPYICERFYRVDKSRSKQTGGTGLGLSIVKHIVALYGGKLNIESELGAGTTVTVTLPSKAE